MNTIMELSFENNKSGNGGYITLKNSAEDVGRLTYTIVPELKKLIVSYVMVFPKFEGQGLGKKLVARAEEIAKHHDKQKMTVTSGVGVRDYYRNLGYIFEPPYLVKKLV